MSLAWGGQRNGHISTALLAPVAAFRPLASEGRFVDWRGGFLRKDAAAQFTRMARDCEIATGKPLLLSEGYRPFSAQKARFEDPDRTTLAAYPGTSGHGWALSADYTDNPQEVVDWVLQNAHLYGFDPSIVSERWHLDYTLTPRIHAAASDYNPIQSEEDEMTEDEKKTLKKTAADAAAAREHADTAKQAVARLEAALIGEGDFTVAKNVEKIKKSQGRIERDVLGQAATSLINVVRRIASKLKA